MRRISVALIVLSAAASLWAHHSPTAIFQKIYADWLGQKADWVNPHIVVFIDAQGGSGTEWWKFESNPPAWFRRVGVGRVDFAKAIGQTVTVQRVLAKDGSHYGYLPKNHVA